MYSSRDLIITACSHTASVITSERFTGLNKFGQVLLVFIRKLFQKHLMPSQVRCSRSGVSKLLVQYMMGENNPPGKRKKYEITHVLACGQCPRAFYNCKDVNWALWPCIKELVYTAVNNVLVISSGKRQLQGKRLLMIKMMSRNWTVIIQIVLNLKWIQNIWRLSPQNMPFFLLFVYSLLLR